VQRVPQQKLSKRFDVAKEELFAGIRSRARVVDHEPKLGGA
jgi:hypothetical protein